MPERALRLIDMAMETLELNLLVALVALLAEGMVTRAARLSLPQ
jgi:hypothetical protein